MKKMKRWSFVLHHETALNITTFHTRKEHKRQNYYSVLNQNKGSYLVQKQ